MSETARPGDVLRFQTLAEATETREEARAAERLKLPFAGDRFTVDTRTSPPAPPGAPGSEKVRPGSPR